MLRYSLLLSTLVASPILAQQAEAPEPAPPAAGQPAAAAQHVDEHPHHHGGEEIVVTGHLVRELDLLAGKSVIGGTELQRELRPQLGDTLARLPSVSATSFSPGASRPVLRGFSAERIRVLTDGIGSIDASNTSADHAVTIDPLTAERIEVLRGPAVLLYGGQAIGGAVNIIDRRIPRTVPKDGDHADAIGVLGSASDERSVGAAVDAAIDGGLVFHVDGSLRKTGDLRVGGYILSRELREEQLGIAAEELAEGHAEEAEEALELANSRGEIANSATEQKSAGAGAALIRDRFNAGISLSLFDSNYGIPGRPGFGHHGEEGEGGKEEEGHGEVPVSIDLHQVRGDLRAEYAVGGGFIDKARLRIGAADYEHTEFEGEDVGTVFKSRGVEGRLELAQADRGGWRGATGAQAFYRDFEAVGAEAFLPPNTSTQLGLFTLQEFAVRDIGVEASARVDQSNAKASTLGIERNFTALSLAGGASYALARHVEAGINLSRTERGPSPEELFSNGPHIATQAFEIGDPDLAKEKSFGAEAYFRIDRPGLELGLTAFANWFDDFIYEGATGEERRDGLPVFRYRQQDATYHGFEAEASVRLFGVGDFRFVGDMVADYVRATVKGIGPVPRIPPMRLLTGIEAQSPTLDARAEVEWVGDQNRVAAMEEPTDGFTLVNASLAWRPWGRERESNIMLSASNILDVDARRHASFTKAFVPLAGRDIRLSARLSF